jgi:hypothetical protein
MALNPNASVFQFHPSPARSQSPTRKAGHKGFKRKTVQAKQTYSLDYLRQCAMHNLARPAELVADFTIIVMKEDRGDLQDKRRPASSTQQQWRAGQWNREAAGADVAAYQAELALANETVRRALAMLNSHSLEDSYSHFSKVQMTDMRTVAEVIKAIIKTAVTVPAPDQSITSFLVRFAADINDLFQPHDFARPDTQLINFKRILTVVCYETLLSMSESSPKNSNHEELCRIVHLIGEMFVKNLLMPNIVHTSLSILLENENPVDGQALITTACQLLLVVGEHLDLFSQADHRTLSSFMMIIQSLKAHPQVPAALAALLEEVIASRSKRDV